MTNDEFPNFGRSFEKKMITSLKFTCNHEANASELQVFFEDMITPTMSIM